MHPRSLLQLENIKKDKEDQVLCCEVKLEKKKIVLCNQDSSEFFMNMFKIIDSYSGEN